MSAPPSPVRPKAPQLGAFPLDHFRECKEEIKDYYKCLEKHDSMAPMCRDEVRIYLKCRMDRGLMNKADIATFGIPETEFVATRQHKDDLQAEAKRSKVGVQIAKVYETKYKSRDLEKDDGFEVQKGAEKKM